MENKIKKEHHENHLANLLLSFSLADLYIAIYFVKRSEKTALHYRIEERCYCYMEQLWQWDLFQGIVQLSSFRLYGGSNFFHRWIIIDLFHGRGNKFRKVGETSLSRCGWMKVQKWRRRDIIERQKGHHLLCFLIFIHIWKWRLRELFREKIWTIVVFQRAWVQ